MVSWRLCHQLVELGVHENRDIVVFGEEPHAAYDRVNLTSYFELPEADDLLLSKPVWYAEHGIELHTSRRILSINRDARVLLDDQGVEHAYGQCVLATGSRAFLPPIDGVDADGVFVYRTIEDIEAIQAAAEDADAGVVIGGGLLGLEAADVLGKMGVRTTVVQAANTLMSRQLNEDGGGYLLREVAAKGMRVRLKEHTDRIEKTDTGLNLSFRSGDSMRADLVIVAAGISPCDELAKDCGLATAARGGVIINDKLETDDPDVFAIGECASHHGKVYGLVAPGYEMADALAVKLAGKKSRYTGSDESCRLKLMGVEVGVFGDYMQEGQYHVHRGESTYRSLVLSHGRLVGATVVGDWDQTAEVDRAVREQRKLPRSRIEAFERTGDLFDGIDLSSVLLWPDQAIVCNCTRTSCAVLKQAVVDGCATVDSLTDTTGAGGVCGSCQPQLAEFVGENAAAFTDTASSKGSWLLWGAACVALIVGLAFWIAPPLPAAQSVQSGYYQFTQIWTDSLIKQITGYTIAGLSLLAVLLSARKRLRFLSFGNYGFWRAAHSWLGVCTLAGIFLHTGLNFGENLNLWLLICFLALNLVGGLAAVTVAAEKRISGPQGARLRGLFTRLHILFFLPYPVLLGFHIAKVYLY